MAGSRQPDEKRSNGQLALIFPEGPKRGIEEGSEKPNGFFGDIRSNIEGVGRSVDSGTEAWKRAEVADERKATPRC
jgi:hypothetical protein